MTDYENEVFVKIIERIENSNDAILNVQLDGYDALHLQYFLTRKFYIAVIVDDYLQEIRDKDSLLEALYYQARLITTHDLNWDAIDEGIADLLKGQSDSNGICFIFRDPDITQKIPKAIFDTFSLMIQQLNTEYSPKKVKVLIADNTK